MGAGDYPTREGRQQLTCDDIGTIPLPQPISATLHISELNNEIAFRIRAVESLSSSATKRANRVSAIHVSAQDRKLLWPDVLLHATSVEKVLEREGA